MGEANWKILLNPKRIKIIMPCYSEEEKKNIVIFKNYGIVCCVTLN